MDKQTLLNEAKKLAINTGIPAEGRRFEDRISLIYEILGSISDEVFKRACSTLLKNSHKFPTIADFEAAIKDAAQALVYRGDDAPRVACQICNGSGYITTEKIINGINLGDFVFRCSCQNGAFQAKNVPLWDEKYRRKGYVPKEEVDGICSWDKEGGDFVAAHEEQHARLNTIIAIRHLIVAKLGDEAQEKLVDLDNRIDRYREKHRHEQGTPVAQAA